MECIIRAKNTSVNLTGTVGRLEMRNCAKEIFLRPCSKDLPVLMQLGQIAKTVQVLTGNSQSWFGFEAF